MSILHENWHAIEGPNGQCACGMERGSCGDRLTTFVAKERVAFWEKISDLEKAVENRQGRLKAAERERDALLDEVALKSACIKGMSEFADRLVEAAKAVCWFDWSDNDNDAVAAIGRLRQILSEGSLSKSIFVAIAPIKYHCHLHGLWDASLESGCPICVVEARKRIRELESALLRCVREIPPQHIPGDVYEQAQAALGQKCHSEQSFHEEFGAMSEWRDEDGYPTDAALERVEKWGEPEGYDWRGLMDFVKSVWWMPDWGWHEEEGKDSLDKPVTKLHVSTAGWSGNESLIRALEANWMFMAMCWEQSRRGGHYIFELKPSISESSTDSK